MSTKAVRKQTLTPSQVFELITEKDSLENKAERRLILRNSIIDGDLALDNLTIKSSLDFEGCEFRGSFKIYRTKFEGHFISFDKVIITGDLVATSLEGGNGYSLYLRKARIREVFLVGAKNINVLCIGGLRSSEGSDFFPHIRINGAAIDRISLDPTVIDD